MADFDFAMGGKMLTQAVSGIANHLVAREQFKMNEQMRKHREAMNAIARAQQLNSLTIQETQVRDAGVRASMALQLQSEQDKATAEVHAAASGVAGNSVDATMRNLERSALNANAARKATINSKMQAIGQERKNAKLDAVYGRDIGVRLKPSASMALLNLGTTLLKTYDENQPKGKTSADHLNTTINSIRKRF